MEKKEAVTTMKSAIVLSALAAASALSAPVSAGLIDARDGKEGDVNIGVDASGQLVIEFGGEPVALPAISGLLSGFGLDEPGFFALEEDEPDENIFVLGPGASIVLEVLSFDPALKAWTPGFADILDQPGDTWTIGAAPFDTHPFWHIDANDPTFIAPPGQSEWNATFRLLDTGTTGYLPSEPVTVTFTPEPGTLGLLIAAGLVGRRRRLNG
ncbi:MAG: hypothetical protein DCC65_06030 [Planctomycetota bacterium]|nr:MAG: hypothetical protein DCC65_06030 [Planctomycetota bacterium]